MILSGTVEASLGEEKGQLSVGQAALIPQMVPHGVRNTGAGTTRCVGFFAAATVVSTFDQPMMPFGQQVIGTPPVQAAGQAPVGQVGASGGVSERRVSGARRVPAAVARAASFASSG